MKNILLLLSIIFLQQKISFAQLAGFILTGNPQSATGATWTFQDSVNGIWYDLKGILFEPPTGNLSYPAVIINHGTGGNVNGYSKNIAMKMVQWGFVCIATNLCHAAGVPVGAPGDTSVSNFGASTNNYLRDMKCWDILASLNYVDSNCIMAFGHSRGAYTTTGLVASYPAKFICAGHTAGGATTQIGFTAPATSLAAQTTCPYIIHHGDSDKTVPVEMDSVLNNVFDTTGISHQFYVYHGYSHQQMSMDSLMFVRTHDWFVNHSCIATSANEIAKQTNLNIFPNPAQSNFAIDFASQNFSVEIYDVTGRMLYAEKNVPGKATVGCNSFAGGICLVRIVNGKNVYNKKIVIAK